MTTYYQRAATDPAITGRQLSRTAGSSTTTTVSTSIVALTTDTVVNFISPAADGLPADLRINGGVISAVIDVNAIGSSCSLSLTEFSRRSNSGLVRASQTVTFVSGGSTGTGVKTVEIDADNASSAFHGNGTGDVTDRLDFRILATNSNMMNTEAVTLNIDGSGHSVTVPWNEYAPTGNSGSISSNAFTQSWTAPSGTGSYAPVEYEIEKIESILGGDDAFFTSGLGTWTKDSNSDITISHSSGNNSMQVTKTGSNTTRWFGRTTQTYNGGQSISGQNVAVYIKAVAPDSGPNTLRVVLRWTTDGTWGGASGTQDIVIGTSNTTHLITYTVPIGGYNGFSIEFTLIDTANVTVYVDEVQIGVYSLAETNSTSTSTSPQGFNASVKQILHKVRAKYGVSYMSGWDPATGYTYTTVPQTLTGAAALTASSTLAAGALRAALGASVLSATSTLVSDGTVTTSGTTHQGAASLSAASTLAVAGTRTAFGAVSLSATSSLTAAGSRTAVAAAALTASSVLTSAGTSTNFGAAAMSATSTLGASGAIVTKFASASFASTSTLSSAGLVAKLGAAALTATSTFTSAGLVIKFGASVLTATSTLTSAGLRTAFGAATLTSASTLTSAGLVTKLGTASFSAISTLISAALRAAVAVAAFTASSTLTSAGLRTAFGATTLTSASTLTASAGAVLTGEATLTATSTLVSVGLRTATPAVAMQSVSFFGPVNLFGADDREGRWDTGGTIVTSGLADPWGGTTASRVDFTSGQVYAKTDHYTDLATNTEYMMEVLVKPDDSGIPVTFNFSVENFGDSGHDVNLDGKVAYQQVTVSGTEYVRLTRHIRTGSTPNVSFLFYSLGGIAAGKKIVFAGARLYPASAPVRVTQPGAAVLTATSTLGAGGIVTEFGAVSMTATSALASTAVRTAFGAASLSATSTLASAALRTVPGAATLTATSTLTSATVRTALGAAVLSASSVLTSAAVATDFGAATLTATSTFSASVAAVALGEATFTATSSFAASGFRSGVGAVSLTATSGFTAGATRVLAVRRGTALILDDRTATNLSTLQMHVHLQALGYEVGFATSANAADIMSFDLIVGDAAVWAISDHSTLLAAYNAGAAIFTTGNDCGANNPWLITGNVGKGAGTGSWNINRVTGTGHPIDDGSWNSFVNSGDVDTGQLITTVAAGVTVLATMTQDTDERPAFLAAEHGSSGGRWVHLQNWPNSISYRPMVKAAINWLDPVQTPTELSSSSTFVAGGAITKFGAASLAGTSTLAAAGVVTKLGSTSLTATSTLATAASQTHTAASAMAGTSTLVAGVQGTQAGAASLTATSTLAATAVATDFGAAALAATSTLAAAGVATDFGAASLAATSTLVSAGVATDFGAAALTATSTLVAPAVVTEFAVAALTATSTLTSVGVRVALGTATFTASSVLTSAGLVTRFGAAALSATSVFTAAAAGTRFAGVTLSATSVLAVSAVAVDFGDAEFSATSVLVAGAVRVVLPQVVMTATSTFFIAFIGLLENVWIRHPSTGVMVKAVVYARKTYLDPFVRVNVRSRVVGTDPFTLTQEA